MATVQINLGTGLKIGDVVHLEAEIRETTAGDIVEAMEESEKLVMVPGPKGQEPQLVASPTLVGINTLRRQIVRIGTYKGPLSLSELKRLTPDDLNSLQLQAELLDAASVAELASRGRDDSGTA